MIRKLKSGQYRLYSRKVDPKTGKRRNLAQLQRQPNDRRPGRHSEHERPAPETTTILLASRWISAAEKSIKKAGQHAV